MAEVLGALLGRGLYDIGYLREFRGLSKIMILVGVQVCGQ